ncbi:hypothetical protein [Deinococcus kurensis]|uniref:hypothetical protein n=1 Tax=Deinococcus kurensis TaxID=2662757 RepID=UPI0012D2C314|nr:hypothetical protein [Deinococcus kurensis]
MNLLPLFLTLLPGAALAAAPTTPSPVKLTASTSVVTKTTKDGKTTETLTDASRVGVVPGTVLELAQTFQNVSAQNLSGLKLNLPLDKAVTFQSASCTVAGVTTLYSVDGKTFAQAPLMKTVTVTENGKQVQKQVEVRPSEYRSVRWELATLKAGTTGRCAVRAVVR